MLFLFCMPLHKYSRKKRKPLYTCFIDLCKAFDKVHHGLLWEKLASVGLSSALRYLPSCKTCMHRNQKQSYAEEESDKDAT